MKERRKIYQKKIYDENGKLKYTVIPNYVKTDYFMSETEITFFKKLIKAICKIRENYQLNLDVFPQVAINRLIKQNNQREKELEKNIFAKSIDYTIYNKETNEIFCCIELNGNEHKNDVDRIERDKLIDTIFKECNIYLIWQDVQEDYDLDKIINKILKKEE